MKQGAVGSMLGLARFSTPTEAYLKSHQNQRFFPGINSIKSDCIIGPRVSRGGTRFKFLFSFVREI